MLALCLLGLSASFSTQPQRALFTGNTQLLKAMLNLLSEGQPVAEVV